MAEDYTEHHRKFVKDTLANWAAIESRLFPEGVPASAKWTDPGEIIRVLNVVAAKRNMNHTFFPGGGGLDLNGARPSNEKGCIELMTGLNIIAKPVELAFNYFGPAALEWSYFRLESGGLKLTDVYEFTETTEEELTELEPGVYVERSAWDAGYYGYDDEGFERKLPAGARPVIRFTKGAFVIFAKGSTYNAISNTYDGRHNKMNGNEFHRYIESAAKGDLDYQKRARYR